ncbi:pilus assembly PilX family protein [Acinetobacter sp. ANC 3832]|uniref:pilus assembly PilX family protein n=1 Tax=Acinetobacter sp. ANC 3832 TaxID=1977874 RepID=UPI000A34B996|nr:pilus assembly PilX N-terminal domain-containing protein [Acinetobacter sp. ANC 3832]OTG96325.1 pilus assembly protein PilX [Acinetobacter sp. ANC 3832]
MKKSQAGATLIVVLIFLVAMTIIGTLAIRQSMVSLSIATNSQVQQLLTQSSDAALFKSENPADLAYSLSPAGLFGYINNANDKNKELVFCFRGDQTQFFSIRQASLMQWKEGSPSLTNNSLGIRGYCDSSPQSTNWFTSGRKAVLTQISVKFPTDSSLDNPFFDRVRGSDSQKGQIEEAKRVKIFAVSIMPSLSKASRSDINDCLKGKMSQVTPPDDKDTSTLTPDQKIDITACLTNLNVPFTTQVSEYTITQDFT